MPPPAVRKAFRDDVLLKRWSLYGEDPDPASHRGTRDHLQAVVGVPRVSVRMGEDGLMGLLHDGFYKTQLWDEIESSGGLYEPAFRAALERETWAIANRDPRLHPVYGYLTESEADVAEPMLGYLRATHGSARLLLREGTHERCTLTFGDSLLTLKMREVAPCPTRGVWHLAYPLQPPWPPAATRARLSNGPFAMSFVEAQIFGGVQVADIESVIFDQDPSEQLAHELAGGGFVSEGSHTFRASAGRKA